MDLVLREAGPADSTAVAEVFLASRRRLVPCAPLAHSDDEVQAWVAGVLVPGGGCTVALAGGTHVGFVARSATAGVGWIDHLYVSPDWVAQGVGSRLLAHALQKLPRPVRLFTFQANERARRFYAERGFVVLQAGDGSDNEERCPDLLLEWAG